MSLSESDHLVKHDYLEKVEYKRDTGTVSMETTMSRDRIPPFVYVLSFFSAIGGLLFGYDTGVISGAMLLLQRKFHPTTVGIEVIVSTTILFASIFSPIGGLLNDRFGRKFVIMLAAQVFTSGAIILCLSQNITMLIIGRSFLGIAIGFVSTTVPVYIAECVPVHIRGLLVTLYNMFIAGGQMIAAIVDGVFSYDQENGWRYMFGLAGVPSVIQFIGFLLLPESPRWLIKKGRVEQATKTLEKLKGTNSVEEEIRAIQESIRTEQLNNTDSEGSGSILIRMIRTPVVRRALILGCGLQLFQQLSGINTVMYYSATIIKMTGVRDDSKAIWLAAATATVNFLSAFLGVFLVEKVGRRPLILGSFLGVFISLIVLAIGFQLEAFNSPRITTWDYATNESLCFSYRQCDDCVENTDCGFCYTEEGNLVLNGSCLPVTSKEKKSHKTNICNSDPFVRGRIWAYEYCPTRYSMVGFCGLVMYLIFFSVEIKRFPIIDLSGGLGPMPWTINSEIYPLWARSTGNALATATNWTFNLIVSMTFLSLTKSITTYGTYWLLCGIVFCGIIFTVTFLPETKGRQLEEVEGLFEDASFNGCPCSKEQ